MQVYTVFVLLQLFLQRAFSIRDFIGNLAPASTIPHDNWLLTISAYHVYILMRDEVFRLPVDTNIETLEHLDCEAGTICGALRDLVPCAQFEKREKHPWRTVT